MPQYQNIVYTYEISAQTYENILFRPVYEILAQTYDLKAFAH